MMDEYKIAELEQRVSKLEGWKEGTQSLLESIRVDLDDVKNRLTFLDRKIDEKFHALDQKIESLREELHGEIQDIDKKFNRFFIWMIGIQFGILISP